ncbi:outer membrane lipoprotein carrier protein LolA [Acanthopleuribacter pedis]|uniref:Outer membrane lipoprotein carrier protein LolA n=1 Tax=Acanthopleuribacter pedis TaxID=442870 RepID=A0A8J7U7Z0_9BACT|nr:outer membrane lipoprotein carrier protein LolA [Acanthopleuribacter pedis]MBO1323023.1 outer membrane lipoprotein carrier protein LolA [Acanthopleuribacter pedis]
MKTFRFAMVWVGLMSALTGVPLAAQAPADLLQHPVAVEHPGLTKISQQLQETPVVRARFEQEKKIKALRRPLRSSGRFLFARDHGLYWHTLQPFDTQLVINEAGMVQKENGAVTLDISVEDRPIIHSFTKVFMALFAGDKEQLAKTFDLFLVEEEGEWWLGLKPKRRILKKVMDHIRLKGDLHLEEIHFIEKSGDQTIMKLTGVSVDPPQLSDDERDLLHVSGGE